MKRSAIVAALFFVVLGMLGPVIVAAADTKTSPEDTSDAQRLLRVIEEQQKRLDAQDEELAEQQKALQGLRKEVETLQGQSGIPAPTGIAGETAAPSQAKEKSFKAAGAAEKEEWPGFYRVPGTNTQFKIGGFAELDIIHDTNDVQTPSAFVTQAIRTRGPREGDGQTSFSVQATRLSLATRTPLEGSTLDGMPRRVTTFISADFFNNLGSTTPELRLRQAYGEVSNFLHLGGDLLLGQAWSTYTNLYAVPNTLEFWAPNSIFGTRAPLVRWTMPFGDEWKLKLAAEGPNVRNIPGVDTNEIDSSDPTVNVESRTNWPDGVVALSWERELFNLSGAFVARDLRARTDDGDKASAFGWGATFQGRINMPDILKDDFMQFSLTYGEGIGSLMNDFPPDAVYDVVDNDLKPLETLAWFVTYHHQWSPKFHSLATFGWLEQDNRNVQGPTAYKETQYSSLGLAWTPDPRWLLGTEVVYGRREDKDGKSGSNVRTVITSRFNF